MNQSNIQELTPTKNNKNRLLTFNQTFQSSILDKPQKFSLDKTLVKGIKQNDSSKIVQNGQQADLGQTSDLYDEQKQIEEVFVETRKKYDHFKQITVKIQQSIQKLKKQKQILNAQKDKVQANYTGEEKQFKKIQNELEKLSQMCQSAEYARDVRVQMSEFLRQDILYYKKHCFEANSKIVRNHNKIKSLNNQNESSRKVSSNCKSLIYSIEKKITQKQNQRYEKISSYHEIINKKVQNNIKRQERQRMIESSMMEALNGKMPEQQQQKKLLLVNLALKKMLKLKMEREMQRFNEIETTFRKIKQHTTVKRADQFIERFIKREKNYGQLLQSISKSEDKISSLKQEKQKLEREYNEIIYEKQRIQDKENQKKNQLNRENISKIDIIRQKLLQNENLKNKTFSFVTKFLSGFDQKSRDEVKQQLTREKVNVCLKKVLEKVNKFLQGIKNEESESKLKQIYIESKNLTLPSNLKSKNLRIKTVTGRDENTISVMEDHDVAYDDLSQREYLNQNRKQIKKSAYLRNRIKTRAY